MTIEDMKKACEIFMRNDLGGEFFDADHDIIYGPAYEKVEEQMAPEDLKILEEMGWHEGEYDSLDHFV